MSHLVLMLIVAPSGCAWIPLGTCGNRLVEGEEACDDGNDVDTDACTNVCEAAVCGDGIVWAGQEECDEGALNANDGTCSLKCQIVGSQTTPTGPTADTSEMPSDPADTSEDDTAAPVDTGDTGT
ncbi:MAG: DUF4215 domain-containing protein [Myxococcota bacterium]